MLQFNKRKQFYHARFLETHLVEELKKDTYTSLEAPYYDMKYKNLADRVRYFKEDEKGVATMCRAMEEMRNETARETEHAKAIKVGV